RYEGEWIDCLGQTYKVFRRSVASLQFLIEGQMRTLRRTVMADGANAIARTTGDGDRNWTKVVETEFDIIRRLDELDAIEMVPEAGDENPLDARDRARQEGWWEAFHDWADDALHFDFWGPSGPDDPVRRLRYLPGPNGRETLVDIRRLGRHLAGLLRPGAELHWPAGHGHPAGHYSESLTGRRVQSQRRGVDLARLGHPLIDALADYFDWDDRGVCSAMWRFRPSCGAARPAELYFRFDYIVEADVRPARDAMAADAHASSEGTRRQADALFPPRWATVWLDADLNRVTDAAQLELLNGRYRKETTAGLGRDYNIQGGMWDTIAARLPDAEPDAWAVRCGEARRRSLEALDEAERLPDARESAARRGEILAEVQAEQLESRAAHTPEALRSVEQAEIERHRRWARALIEGIRQPVVRLVALGAIFLADWSPFPDSGANPWG
ncbi:MAG TPA: hypothetical protein VH092_04680, partial [Urbifossiella sp.]|nr:hypothetical protein [Urbifossiella sp.]